MRSVQQRAVARRHDTSRREVSASGAPDRLMSKREHVGLSRFRTALARFLRFSERSARNAGITPTQYLVLLHLGGAPDRDWATVGELAARLHASAHGTTALVGRCCAAGLTRKRRHQADSRRVEVHLTARGRKLLNRVAVRNRAELQSLRDVFHVAHVS
jgi:DNA-binding MarR family transcriptional regulator